MTTAKIIERLISENPKLHYMSAEGAANLTQRGYPCEAGPVTFAVPADVIRYLARVVAPDHLTIETGVGHTTVALAALSKHHICVTVAETESIEMIQRYLDEVGVSRSKVTFVLGSSDTALPKLSVPERLDFAFIDGCHGYPFPALDWHYVDKHLKVGGIIGFDNTEIRAVRDHCAFLEENESYQLIETLSGLANLGDYGVKFYSKVRDEKREWLYQLYNKRPQPRRRPIRRALGRLLPAPVKNVIRKYTG